MLVSYQANWELVIMWVYDKPVDSGYMRFNWWTLFELQMETIFHVNDLRGFIVGSSPVEAPIFQAFNLLLPK